MFFFGAGLFGGPVAIMLAGLLRMQEIWRDGVRLEAIGEFVPPEESAAGPAGGGPSARRPRARRPRLYF